MNTWIFEINKLDGYRDYKIRIFRTEPDITDFFTSKSPEMIFMKTVVSEYDGSYEYGYYHDTNKFYNNKKINDDFAVELANDLKYEKYVGYH